MTEQEKADRWERYYQRQQGREPHPLLLDVLARFNGFEGQAVDLGCGSGIETRALLARGWQVLAVDEQPWAIERLAAGLPESLRARLQTQVIQFEAPPVLPSADLIYAAFSLPFCQPEAFPALWDLILKRLNPGGRFAGQLFGPRDSWAGNPAKSIHSRSEVLQMLNNLEIEYFWEEEREGRRSTGEFKHWHVFHVIARKN